MNHSLIIKYLKGEALPHEKLEILTWIEADVQNKKQFLQFRQLYDAAIWADGNTNSSQNNSLNANKSPLILIKQWLKVAAIIVFTIGGTLFVQNINNKYRLPLSQIIEVPIGQHVNLTLSDGTKVSLNSNSSLQFPTSFDSDKRIVILDGEGYFEVAHNSNKPFHVMTQKCDVKVLGTTFNVLAYNSSSVFETSLLKGSVKINDLLTNQELLLKPNEQARLINGKLIASKLESEDGFLWRNGIYVFKKETFAEIFRKLENYYQINIIVRNTDIYQYTCTGKFRQKEGLEHIIKVLQSTNHFNYKRNDQNNSFTIY